MSNLLNASTTLVRIVEPEASRLLAHDPALARKLKRAAEFADDSLTDAVCELGSVRRAHLRAARAALHEVRGCLRVALDDRRVSRALVDEALALAQNLLEAVDVKARSA